MVLQPHSRGCLNSMKNWKSFCTFFRLVYLCSPYSKDRMHMVRDCAFLGSKRQDVVFEFVFRQIGQSVQQKLQWVKHGNKTRLINLVVSRQSECVGCV